MWIKSHDFISEYDKEWVLRGRRTLRILWVK